MSKNHSKYFEVTTTSVVMANNKTDAAAISEGRRGVVGKILSSDRWIDQITAAEAKGESTELSAHA